MSNINQRIQEALNPLVLQMIASGASVETAGKYFEENIPIELIAEKDWTHRPEIRSEFKRLPVYIAYCKAARERRLGTA